MPSIFVIKTWGTKYRCLCSAQILLDDGGDDADDNHGDNNDNDADDGGGDGDERW